MLAAYTTRRLPSASRRRSWERRGLPAGQRSVPSGWRGKSAPVKRPVFQEVAAVGGPYPEAGADEADLAACALCAGRAGANSVVRSGVGSRLMPQFQAQVPHPLCDHLPALLSPGRVAAPAIGVMLLVFICKRRLKGAAMQVQLDDIAGSECLLRQIGEEEFVDDACARDANGALLLARGMGRHDHAAQHAFGPHRHARAVVEAAHAFGFPDAVGTDQGANADAPGRAGDRAPCTLCRESRTRSPRDRRVRPLCHIAHRAGAGYARMGVDTP